MIKVEPLKSIAPKQEVSRTKDTKNKPTISFCEVLKKAKIQKEKDNTQKVMDKKDKADNISHTIKESKTEKGTNKAIKEAKADHPNKKGKQKEEKKSSHKIQPENKAVPIADAKIVEAKKIVASNNKKTSKDAKKTEKMAIEPKTSKIKANDKDQKHIKLVAMVKKPTEDKKIETEEANDKKRDGAKETKTADTKTSIEKTNKHSKPAKVTVDEIKEKMETGKESEKSEIENRKIGEKEVKAENKVQVAKNTKVNHKEKVNLWQKRINDKKQSESNHVIVETKANIKGTKETENPKVAIHKITKHEITDAEGKHLTLKITKTKEKAKNKEQHKQKPISSINNKKTEKETEAKIFTENTKNTEHKEKLAETKQFTDEIKQSVSNEKEIKALNVHQNKQKAKQIIKEAKTEKKENSEQPINTTKVENEKPGIKNTQNQTNKSFNYNSESKDSKDAKEIDTKDNSKMSKHTTKTTLKTTINATKETHNNTPNISPHTLTNNTMHSHSALLEQSNHPSLDKVIEEIDKIANLKPPITKSITIRLNPPHLGNLHLKVSLDIQKNLTASISVHDKDTYRTIVNHLDSLKDYLATNGIKVQNIDVHNSFNENFMNQFSGGSGSFQQQGQSNGNQTQSGGFGYLFRGEGRTNETGRILKRTATSGIDITA